MHDIYPPYSATLHAEAVRKAYLQGFSDMLEKCKHLLHNISPIPPIILKPGTWLPIETAPKDGTAILAICRHNADPYTEDGGCWLTPYGAWCEGGTHVGDGPNVIAWGGGYDTDCPDSPRETMPDWWFQVDGDTLREAAAFPVCWMPIPAYTSTNPTLSENV